MVCKRARVIVSRKRLGYLRTGVFSSRTDLIVLLDACGLDHTIWFHEMLGQGRCLTLDAIAQHNTEGIALPRMTVRDTEQEYHYGQALRTSKDTSPPYYSHRLMNEHLKSLSQALSFCYHISMQTSGERKKRVGRY